jgi:hypothetical protein
LGRLAKRAVGEFAARGSRVWTGFGGALARGECDDEFVSATLMFGIGSGVEKASTGTTSTVAHQETPGGETGGAEAPAPIANNQEAIFGINPESVPLIVIAIAGSIRYKAKLLKRTLSRLAQCA